MASERDPSTPATTLAARLDRWLPWLILVVALLVLASLRTVENGVELDRYPDAAARIRQGDFTFDSYHGFGFPLAIAATAAVTGLDDFAAAIALAAAAALLMMSAAVTLATNLRPGAARTTRWLFGTNALFWTAGTSAAADLPGASLLLAGAALLSAPDATRSGLRLAGAGALLGAAVAFHPALLAPALPLLGIAAWCSRRPSRWLLLGGAFAVGYLPHVVPCLLSDRPIIGANWHNLYLKHVCDWDGAQLRRDLDAGAVPSLWAFVGEHHEVMRDDTARALGQAVDATLPAALLGSRAAVPGVFWWLPAAAALALLVAARRRGLALLALALVAIQLVLVAVFHRPTIRLMLPSLAVLLLGAGVGLEALRRRYRVGQILTWSCIAAAFAFGLRESWRHREAEPVREVEVARTVPGLTTRPVAALASFRLLDRHVEYPCWGIQRKRAEAFADRDGAWAELRRDLEACGATILIVGQRTLPAAFAAIAGADAPADFTWLHRDADVVIAEFAPPMTTWIAAVEATPRAPRRGQPCVVRLDLAAGAQPDQLASVGVAILDPDRNQTLLDLVRQPDASWSNAFVPDRAGGFTVQPILLLRDGRIERGQPLRVEAVE